MGPDPNQIALEIAEIFEKLDIRYFIGGSLASSVLGEPRTSVDVDMIAEIPLQKVEILIAELKKNFHVPEGLVREAVRERRSFNVIHSKEAFKVDIFVLKDEPFWRQELERSQRRLVSTEPKREAYFATPEDIVLAKLVWFRKGNEVSDRQWRDILGVLKVRNAQLDRAYLKKTSIELRVDDLLQRAWKDLG